MMRTRVICLAGATGASALILSLGWYSGVDYLQRGADPAFWTTEAVLGALWAFLGLRLKFCPAAPALGRPAARILWTFLTFFIVLGECWYRGIDLATRGEAQAFALMVALAFAYLCWSFPGWKPIFSDKHGT
ncbi:MULTISPECIES: hypothetical protein [Paraburkholderia]|uniref:Transmembrane protein n=1 Tax=Paraburkholderia podalyriae TaxID=1938811 RepID=A0ABR7Q1A1_9BURK|nr:hypothetical protein [Paraburkholderia podalyriae]MBC8752283.1 hypothetical protein [Paraburkholderia podalyriae]